jgi:hypothetical protein
MPFSMSIAITDEFPFLGTDRFDPPGDDGRIATDAYLATDGFYFVDDYVSVYSLNGYTSYQ